MLHYTLSHREKVRYNMHMVIVWALSWWYGAGWKQRLLNMKERLAATYDYFSFDLLVRTLFSPYRQISAGKVRGPVGVQLRVFVDRQISRFIGAAVRSILIVAGMVWIATQVLFGIMWLVLWAVVPFLPLVGFVMALSGWVPLWR